ncbi:MAG: GspE/PulE family protein [Gallionella sp.]|nr:GspE/PulE family protein [Gallionella sp.]
MAEIPHIPADLIAQCQAESRTAGRSMLDILHEKLAEQSQQVTIRLAKTLHYPVLDMSSLREYVPVFDVLSFADAMRRGAVIVHDAKGGQFVVIADPFDAALIAWLQEYIPASAIWCLAAASDITAYLALQEESLHAIDQVLSRGEDSPEKLWEQEGLSLKSIAEDTSPVVKLVNSTLYDALKSEASDIHLKCYAGGMAIKYRIDGVLISAGSVSGSETAEQVISRVKVLAELDIAEKRIPQDGRFKIQIKGREIDIRVSIIPSILGEGAVLRILDKQTLTDQLQGLRLDYLGFDADSLQIMRRLSSEPYGMVLVTGPTGSGKTTTLYAAISEINDGQDNIITIEDPVEYQLPGVLQIPVNEKKGLTFAKGLRAILRHDPDKILVGEIRDEETAQIAVQSALTGHLVFTTVHANNVFDVLGRFMHMGVDPYSFVSALNGILAQRLLRMVCPQCAREYQPDERLLNDSGIAPEEVKNYRFVQGLGCGHCRGTGYKGRKAIAEILQMNDEIRELIVAREPIRRIKDAARKNGTRYLREAALEMVRKGETTLQEINRVTFVA